MKNDKFLLGILVGVLVLVVVALVMFFARKDNLAYADGKEPADVVNNYIVAIHKKDYEKAYNYLAELKYKPNFDTFKASFLNHMIDPASAGIEIGKAEIAGENASVEMGILSNPGDPFSGGYRNTEYGLLVKQSGEWKIKQLPYTVWSYDWYNESLKPVQ